MDPPRNRVDSQILPPPQLLWSPSRSQYNAATAWETTTRIPERSQSTDTLNVGPAITNPQSLVSSRHAHAITRDILNTTIREAESNLRTRANHQAEINPQVYAERAISDDDDAPVSKASSTASPQPFVLYDYQVDLIAKGLAAGKKNKEKQEKYNIQALELTTPSAPSRPVSGPPPPPERSTRRAPSARSGPTQPTKKETLEEICRNMDKLLVDGPICDRAFAAMHYRGGGARSSRQDLMDAMEIHSKRGSALLVKD